MIHECGAVCVVGENITVCDIYEWITVDDNVWVNHNALCNIAECLRM